MSAAPGITISNTTLPTRRESLRTRDSAVAAIEPRPSRLQTWIAGFTVICIIAHLVLRFGVQRSGAWMQYPLWLALGVGGLPLLYGLLLKVLRHEFGSDLLAGISIVTSVILGEYLAGTLVVLMLSGGGALESFALRSASSVLRALAKRMPSVAHLNREGVITEVSAQEIGMGDCVQVLPHEICPVDGIVEEGSGSMDESYLTGEPYRISKTRGAAVLSGAMNGENALMIRATRRAADSRYAHIMQVMRDSEQRRAATAPAGRSTGRVVYAAGRVDRRDRMASQRQLDALSCRPRRRHTLSVAHRHSGRHYRRDCPVRETRHHHQRSCGSRTVTKVQDDHLRQDRHADIRPAGAHGSRRRAPMEEGRDPESGSQSGAILQASARSGRHRRVPASAGP